jgi:hypothetical protein
LSSHSFRPSSREIGFFLAEIESSPFIREQRLPALLAEYALPAEAKRQKKAQTSPVRTGETHRRAHIQQKQERVM